MRSRKKGCSNIGQVTKTKTSASLATVTTILLLSAVLAVPTLNAFADHGDDDKKSHDKKKHQKDREGKKEKKEDKQAL